MGCDVVIYFRICAFSRAFAFYCVTFIIIIVYFFFTAACVVKLWVVGHKCVYSLVFGVWFTVYSLQLTTTFPS